MKRKRAVVLISGNGSNLQSLIDAVAGRALDLDIVGVVSNQASAFGLQRATRAGIATQVIEAANGRAEFESRLGSLLDDLDPQLVLLAGFMRILGPAIVDRYAGRMLNIHPSLLPAYPGLHTHRRVLRAGDTLHGCSIHFVTNVLDGGPLVAQAQVPVHAGDNEAALSARVQQREHKLYPLVAQWFASGRLHATDNVAWLDGRALAGPVVFTVDEEIE